MILGPDDRDGQPEAIADDPAGRFDGVGRIECLQSGNRKLSYTSTGWITGRADTVVTAAHEFFPSPSSDGGHAAPVDPRACIFVLFNPDRSVREIAGIRYVVSPWAEDRFRYDSSYDVAIMKLDRSVRVAKIPVIRAPRIIPGSSVELLSFQTGISQADRARLTRGAILPFPEQQLRRGRRGIRITDAARLFSTSANSTAGSSGGVYYVDRQQAAIGLHVGVICDASRPHAAFDAQSCFNFGLYFDETVLALLGSVVSDRPSARQMIAVDAGNGSRLADAGS